MKFVFLSWLIAMLVFPKVAPTATERIDWVAIHHQDDTKWARKTGLSPALVRRLRIAAALQDSDPEGRLEEVDVANLKSRRQALVVVSYGNGHCLTVTVLGRKRSGWVSVWSESEAPDGSGFCHEGMTPNPTVSVSRKQEIVIEIPTERAEQGCATRRLIYSWKGKTYQFARDEQGSDAHCLRDPR